MPFAEPSQEAPHESRYSRTRRRLKSCRGAAPVPSISGCCALFRGDLQMTADLHLRAHQLISQEPVVGLSAAEREWLSAHLQDCADCSARVRQTDQALRSMRSVAIPLPDGLARRTQ